MRRGGQGERLWDRPRSGGACAVGRRRAHLLRRPSRRGFGGAPPAAGGGGNLRAERSRGGRRSGRLRRASPEAGDRQRRGTRTMVGLRHAEGAAFAFSAASRHRDAPPRVRLAQSPERGGGAQRQGEPHRPVDEPFRLVRNSQRSAECSPDRAIRSGAGGLPASCRVARQLVGDFSARAPDLRSRPAGIRALRR